MTGCLLAFCRFCWLKPKWRLNRLCSVRARVGQSSQLEAEHLAVETRIGTSTQNTFLLEVLQVESPKYPQKNGSKFTNRRTNRHLTDASQSFSRFAIHQQSQPSVTFESCGILRTMLSGGLGRIPKISDDPCKQ